MPTRTMSELYVSELQRLYDQELQMQSILPMLIKASRSPALEKLLAEHEQQTATHVDRLIDVFKDLDHKPIPKKCPRVEGLCRECRTVAGLEGNEHVRDVAILATTQHFAHDQIAGYGCARTWANLLGKTQESGLLDITLDEKKAIDRQLTLLANEVNKEAMTLTR